MTPDKDSQRPAKSDSPYAAPNTTPQSPDGRIDDDPSVFAEPWMQAHKDFKADQKDSISGLQMAAGEGDPENSVWDEPSLSRELAGDTPKDAVTWFNWYQSQAALTDISTTWWVTLGVAFASGICAVLGALILQTNTANQFLVVVVAAPVTEEIMKIALAIWVCEKRPWLFSSPTQILICGLVSGFVFAAIENVLYLNFGASTPSLVAWRWSVCVLLHVGCSVIASVGVAKVWTQFQQQKRMPQLSDGSYWFVAAMILHGAYNFAATLMEYGGWF